MAPGSLTNFNHAVFNIIMTSWHIPKSQVFYALFKEWRFAVVCRSVGLLFHYQFLFDFFAEVAPTEMKFCILIYYMNI